MSFSRKSFNRKLREGFLEISERVFVFGCCFTTQLPEGTGYEVYIGHIMDQLHEYFPGTSFTVHNFGEENRPLLHPETIYHFLSSSNNWFFIGQRNVVLMHCEKNGALPVLAFMLAAFLIYNKQCTNEGKNLDLIYRKVPRELLALLFSANPLPSQLRYLEYVFRRNIDLQWAPMSRVLKLDFLKVVPDEGGNRGCRPVFRIYGLDPFVVADQMTKMLLYMPKEIEATRYFRQADSEILKTEINCHAQGDIVHECIKLDDDDDDDDDDNLEEEMMFRNTAIIRSNTVMLGLDETETLRNIKGRFPKNIGAEVPFSEMESSSSVSGLDLPGSVDKEGLVIETRATFQDNLNNLDSEALQTDNALSTTQQTMISGFIPKSVKDEDDAERRMDGGSCQVNEKKTCVDSDQKIKKIDSRELQVSVQRPSHSKIISNFLQVSPAPLTRYRSSNSVLGITALLHDHDEISITSIEVRRLSFPESSISASSPCLLKPVGPTMSSVSPQHPSGKHYIESKLGLKPPLPPPPSPPPPPPLPSALPSSVAPPPPPPPPIQSALPKMSFSNPLIKTTKPRSSSSSVPLPPNLRDSPLTSDVPLPPPPPPPFSNVSIVQNQSALVHSSSKICHDSSFALTTKSSERATPSPRPPPRPPQHACSALLPARSPYVVPPPPAPLSNNLSKPVDTSSLSSSLLGVEEKLKLRTNTRTQALSKKAPLKPYHWLKLTRALQGSLWAEAQKPEEASIVLDLDMSEIESLFSTTNPSSDHGASGKTYRRGSGIKPDNVHLIELRRAYNCEIMLTKVKVSLSDLMNSILALDDSALDIDQVDNLIKFCPTKEEIELLKNYNGEKEKLGKCEQFLMELMKVPRVESKLRVFSFKIQFYSQVSDLRNSLNIVNSVSLEVRNSVKLKRIMQSILSLGNALNHGTARGSAVGFRLDSLLKLSETRSRNSKLTLIHYLCKVLTEKLPEVLNFYEDIVSLEAATKIQLKYLAEEMQAISKGLEKVVQELNASENDGAVSKHFCKTLKEFYGSAEEEVRSLASVYSVVGRNADALSLYFGEDPARCPFEQVVSTLLNFVRMFRRAHEENYKQMELEKKKAQIEAVEIGKAKLNASRSELEMGL